MEPNSVTLEDVSVYIIINVHEVGHKTSTLWSSFSMIEIYFELGKDENVNALKKLMTRNE